MLNRILIATYFVSAIVLTAVVPASAEWRHGCCTSIQKCEDSKLCCAPPPGWANCALTRENYCNYDDCDLGGGNIEE